MADFGVGCVGYSLDALEPRIPLLLGWWWLVASCLATPYQVHEKSTCTMRVAWRPRAEQQPVAGGREAIYLPHTLL